MPLYKKILTYSLIFLATTHLPTNLIYAKKYQLASSTKRNNKKNKTHNLPLYTIAGLGVLIIGAGAINKYRKTKQQSNDPRYKPNTFQPSRLPKIDEGTDELKSDDEKTGFVTDSDSDDENNQREQVHKPIKHGFYALLSKQGTFVCNKNDGAIFILLKHQDHMQCNKLSYIFEIRFENEYYHFYLDGNDAQELKCENGILSLGDADNDSSTSYGFTIESYSHDNHKISVGIKQKGKTEKNSLAISQINTLRYFGPTMPPNDTNKECPLNSS